MNSEKLYAMKMKDLYQLYVAKTERKNRTKSEVDDLMIWMMGYTIDLFNEIIQSDIDVRTFFEYFPSIHPVASQIRGKICGVTIEDIEDPLMKKIRIMDKLIDELSKGKSIDKIKRISTK